MDQFEKLRGNIESVKKVVNSEVEVAYVREQALKLIEESLKIVEELKKHEEWREEMDRHSGSAFDD